MRSIKSKSKLKTGDLLPYFFILPALLPYLLFCIYPVLSTVRLSFFEWNGLDPSGGTFVGLANYIRLSQDQRFFFALKNNLVWTISYITIPVILALIVALLLSNLPKGRNLLSAALVLSYIFSGPTIAIVWGWIYQPNYGALNNFLRLLGLESLTRTWLGNPVTVQPALVVAGSWANFGFFMILFLAGIQDIDPALYDAATIDGAGRFQTFRHITIPCLRNVINMVLVFAYLFSMMVFDLVWIMTPTGVYTDVVATYVFRRVFRIHEHGYGSAMAVILTVIMLGGSALFLLLREREE